MKSKTGSVGVACRLEVLGLPDQSGIGGVGIGQVDKGDADNREQGQQGQDDQQDDAAALPVNSNRFHQHGCYSRLCVV